MIYIKYLGLDFGSSITTVVGISEDSTPYIFKPVNGNWFYSAISKCDSSQSYKFFLDAFIQEDNYVCHDDIKERITEKEGLVRIFLKELFRIIKSNEFFDFSRLEKVCYGYPEYYFNSKRGEYFRVMEEILPDVVRDLSGRRVAIRRLGEPQSAAISYKWIASKFRESEIEANDTILVLDFGGHTFDMALLKANNSGTLVTIMAESAQLRASRDIDNEICQGMGKEISDKIALEVHAKPWDREIEKAKIEMFEKPEGVFTEKHALMGRGAHFVSLKYEEKSIIISESLDGIKEEYEVYIGDVYLQVCNQIVAFLQASNVKRGGINKILFTGGTSRIKYLVDEIMSGISWYVASDKTKIQLDEFGKDKIVILKRKTVLGSEAIEKTALSSENVVALGAALYAMDNEILHANELENDDNRVRADDPVYFDHINRTLSIIKRMWNTCDNYENLNDARSNIQECIGRLETKIKDFKLF